MRRFAFAPATAPEPRFPGDNPPPRELMKKALRPKAPVTLCGELTEGPCSITLAVHTARFPDKGPVSIRGTTQRSCWIAHHLPTAANTLPREEEKST